MTDSETPQDNGLIPAKDQPGLERRRPTTDAYFGQFADLAATAWDLNWFDLYPHARTCC